MTTVTANRNILGLGYSFRFDTENELAWQDFFKFLKGTFPSLDDEEGVSISDGDKGISSAHHKQFPSRGTFRCYEHKKLNILQHVVGLGRVERRDAIASYKKCVQAVTDHEFDAAWAIMPPSARGLFPLAQWAQYFPVKCKQTLHGWYTSSVAESENNSIETARMQDPFNALVTLAEQFAERLAKQQQLALDHDVPQDGIMRGLPPAVVARLAETIQLANAMSRTRCTKVDGIANVYNVGRLNHAGFTSVSLTRYECCGSLKLRRIPCHHVLHVCSVANQRVEHIVPPFLTVSTWREQIGLAGAQNVLRECCPLPRTSDVLQEVPLGPKLRLVIAMKQGKRSVHTVPPTQCVSKLGHSQHPLPNSLQRVFCLSAAGRPRACDDLRQRRGTEAPAGSRRPAHESRHPNAPGRGGRPPMRPPGPTAGLDDLFDGQDAAAAARAAAIPPHVYAGCPGFDAADAHKVVLVTGYNQRGGQAPESNKWCCACYPGAETVGSASRELLERCRVVGFHVCLGCKCAIHTSIWCAKVKNGTNDGEYLCEHCYYMSRLSAPPPPLPRRDLDAAMDDVEQSDDEDVLQRRTWKQTAGPTKRKASRCSICNELGHKRTKCPERDDEC